MSLERFRVAQDEPNAGFATALGELRSGRKTSHWIWYIFPQLAALGRSATAQHYGIRDLDEAVEYLRDPVLRQRLFTIAAVVEHQLAAGARLPALLGGETDSLKLVSSLTLFQTAAGRLEPGNSEAGLNEFVRLCERILDEADREGFPRCAVTQRAISSG